MLGTTNAQVTQNRITATGFVLALSALGAAFALEQPGIGELEALWGSLTSLVPLFCSFVLSLIALSLFLWAGQLDPKGTATVLPIGLGEIALFVAMAQLLEGGLGHLLFNFDEGLTRLPVLLEETSGNLVSVGQLSGRLTWGLGFVAGVAWVWLIYCLPIRVIFREAFGRLARTGLALFFVAALSVAFLLGAQAHRLQETAQGADPGPWKALGHQALLPLEFLE
jgi:hypothetical protein